MNLSGAISEPTMDNAALSSLEQDQRKHWTWIGVMTTIIVMCYWNSLVATWETWSLPMYNHGYLIPLLAVFLLFLRRQPIEPASTAECWIGAGLIILATVIRVAAAYFVAFTVDRISFLICLLGVFLFVGGFRALRWAGPPIAFLVFMFPWPGFLTDHIMRPLQTLATIISTYSLQTAGIDAFRDGNRILLEHAPANVAEQCSGLRMLTIFIAMSIAWAMMSGHRPLWERIFIVFPSSPVIALIANSIRIALYAVFLSLGVEEGAVQRVFHDFAGLVMMPIALVLLFLEVYILSRVVIEDDTPAYSAGIERAV
jgi:exosortase